jgi:2-polyprenyl-3-methyl-5-hydroxy-6-metoxy-1,4-benzoquinol methylase
MKSDNPIKDAGACPACGALDAGWLTGIARCDSCGHRWMRVTADEQRATERATYIDDYAGFRNDPVFAEAIRALIRRDLTVRVPPPARILDVGCGAGEFMSAAAEVGYQVQGIDVSAAAERLCRGRRLDAVTGNFLSYPLAGPFDVVTMWDVIEHLREPAAFLARTRDLLRPGGWLVAKIPGYGELSVALSGHAPRLSGLLLSTPDHVQYFHRASLYRLLSRTAFEPEWLPLPRGGIRGRPSGGSLRRRFGACLARVIRALSGDSNLYFAARLL